jgi:hypothetical protein
LVPRYTEKGPEDGMGWVGVVDAAMVKDAAGRLTELWVVPSM